MSENNKRKHEEEESSEEELLEIEDYTWVYNSDVEDFLDAFGDALFEEAKDRGLDELYGYHHKDKTDIQLISEATKIAKAASEPPKKKKKG